MIHGKYNALAYAIYEDDTEIYRAGNHAHDSQIYVTSGDPHAVGLATMRRYCAATLKEMAELQPGEPVGKVEYVSQKELS